MIRLYTETSEARDIFRYFRNVLYKLEVYPYPPGEDFASETHDYCLKYFKGKYESEPKLKIKFSYDAL